MDMDMEILNKLLLISTVAAILAIYAVKKVLGSSKKEKKKYYPIVGTVLHQLLNFRRLHDYMTELTQKNINFRLLYIDNSIVYTADPAIVEYILKTNFANYGKGWYHHRVLKDLLGDGIFTGRWR
ncbi:Cytochrome [Forsythia ovata]|uniref:Cytochrome n=1 Tax=Forsythia ovata TaxID=205694 RepID=A0ABD1WL44_9LAMI